MAVIDYRGLLAGLLLCHRRVVQSWSLTSLKASSRQTTSFLSTRRSSSSALFMAQQNRGLETRREGASPTEGGMVLYLKAGPDGTSVGDCPFAQFVRLVLEEKGLEYDVKPATQETKPQWLVEHFEGKMPALQHRKECYVESGVIAEYVDFFFPEPPLKPSTSSNRDAAEAAIEGFFPAVAKYLKHVETDDEQHEVLLQGLQGALSKLETHLAETGSDWLCKNSDGASTITLLDCGLIPKLYHLQVGIEGFKNGIPALETDYPNVSAYMKRAFERPSFQTTQYPKETILWGWGNARK